MASINRIADLEQARKATVQLQLTDAERAVRLIHILSHPGSSPVYGQLTGFFRRFLDREIQIMNDVDLC